MATRGGPSLGRRSAGDPEGGPSVERPLRGRVLTTGLRDERPVPFRRRPSHPSVAGSGRGSLEVTAFAEAVRRRLHALRPVPGQTPKGTQARQALSGGASLPGEPAVQFLNTPAASRAWIPVVERAARNGQRKETSVPSTEPRLRSPRVRRGDLLDLLRRGTYRRAARPPTRRPRLGCPGLRSRPGRRGVEDRFPAHPLPPPPTGPVWRRLESRRQLAGGPCGPPKPWPASIGGVWRRPRRTGRPSSGVASACRRRRRRSSRRSAANSPTS